MQRNTQVPVGKHNNRQHASPHHEVATDVKQMPIRPIIILSYYYLVHRRPCRQWAGRHHIRDICHWYTQMDVLGGGRVIGTLMSVSANTIFHCWNSPWASFQIRKIAGCACAGNAGNVSPGHRRLAIPTCITARASRTCRDACRDC